MDGQPVDIERLIGDAWKHAGLSEGEMPPSITELLQMSDENCNIVPSVVSNWISILDQFLAWFSSLYILFLFSLKINSALDCRLQRVMTCIIGNICAHIIAIRRLVLSGLDVQSKQILRSLVEHIDLAFLISTDENALGEFEQTLDGRSSNAFWHKYISKSKIRNKIHPKWQARLGDIVYREFVDYLRQEEEILGMAIHPSLAACQMTCLPGIAQGNPDRPLTLGFVGEVSVFSVRTLSYAVFYMSQYVAEGYVPNEFPAYGLDQDLLSSVTDIQGGLAKGRSALLYLTTYAFTTGNSTGFSFQIPEEFLGRMEL
jgi:hypothetical protein